MKAFKFSLEKVLRLRAFEENKAKIDLASSIMEGERLNARLLEMERQKKEFYRASINGGFDQLRAYESFAGRINIEAVQIAERLQALAEEVRKKREVLAAISAKRKSLDALKEKKMAEYKRESLRENEKEMSDLVGGKIAESHQDGTNGL